MSNINTRLASRLQSILATNGFDAVLQQRSPDSTGDFEISTSDWQNLATVKAVWDNPLRGMKNLDDGAPASNSPRFMTIAYRDDLKDTAKATSTRILVNGVVSNLLTISPIGDKVGLRLYLQAGTGA